MSRHRDLAFLEFSPWHVEESADGCPDDQPYGVVNDESGDVEGCHATMHDAEEQVAALYANDADDEAVETDSIAAHAVVAVEGFDTGEKPGRILDVGGWDQESLRLFPLPLWVQDTQSMWGHEGAVAVGTWDSMERAADGRRILAHGTIPNINDQSRWAVEQIRNQVLRFVSIDVAAADVELEIRKVDEDGWPVDVLSHYTRYEIAGATVCGMPAIAYAVAWLDGMDEPAELTAELPAVPDRVEEPEIIESDPNGIIMLATVGANRDLPLSDRDRAWDADGAETRMRRRASSDGSGDKDTIDWSQYREGFFWYDPDDAESFGGYKLAFADWINGRLHAVWRGVTAVAGVLSGARGGGCGFRDGSQHSGQAP